MMASWFRRKKKPADYRDQLHDFFIKQYPAYVWPTFRDCPYNMWGFNDGEEAFEQFRAWQRFVWVNPESGLTCAQEFATHMQDRDIASMLTKTNAMSLQLLRVEKRTRTGFVGRFVHQNLGCNVLSGTDYSEGQMVSGLTYPWGPAGTYQLTGTTTHFDASELKKSHLHMLFNGVEIRPDHTTYDILQQYDFSSVYAMHVHLHPESSAHSRRQVVREVSQTSNRNIEALVFTLPGHARKALRMVVEKGGMTDLSEFRRFMREAPDTQHFVQNSSMNILHKKGLLLAGYRKEGTGKVPVLTVAPDILAAVRQSLQEIPVPPASPTLAESLDNIIDESRRLHWLTMMTSEEFDYTVHQLCASEKVSHISQDAGLHPRHLLLLLLLYKVGHVPPDVMAHIDIITRLMVDDEIKTLSAELIDILGSKSIKQLYSIYSVQVFKINMPDCDMLTFSRDKGSIPAMLQDLLRDRDSIPKKYIKNPKLFIAANMGGSHTERLLLYRPIIPESVKIDASMELELLMALTSLHQNWHVVRQKNKALLKKLSRIRHDRKDS